MRIVLRNGEKLVGVTKIKIHTDVPTPYAEIIWPVKGQDDPKARIIATESLSNIKKIKDE